ncbi:uncharacterized protein LOC135392882 [Ornithodoros turicata]|uniref:uncharacterized protein LOC135392882 n=1 Tax=Ornithodoros turicata TaxID=34597 RepID=UPI00313952C2
MKLSVPLLLAAILLAFVGSVDVQTAKPIYACFEYKEVKEEERFDSSKYPVDCKYYCGTQGNRKKYGYYRQGEPCAIAKVDRDFKPITGTCSEGQRNGEIICDTKLKPPQCPA